MSIGLAVGAALLLGLAAALQHRAARAQPSQRPLSIFLIRGLLGNRVWLGAVVLMVLGYGLQAAALGEGQLALVEPVLSAYLVVALLAGALLSRSFLTTRDLAGAVAASSGIALFLLQLDPSRGVRTAPGEAWVGTLLSLALLLLISVPLIRRSAGSGQALVLGTLAGVTLGVSDALTKQTIAVVATQRLGALASWEPYLLLVVGAGAFLLQQSAYHAGPLGSSLPALSVLEPVTGTLLGLLAFREGASATVSPGPLLIAILLMLWGVQRLARSDLVTGSRPDPAQA